MTHVILKLLFQHVYKLMPQNINRKCEIKMLTKCFTCISLLTNVFSNPPFFSEMIVSTNKKNNSMLKYLWTRLIKFFKFPALFRKLSYQQTIKNFYSWDFRAKNTSANFKGQWMMMSILFDINKKYKYNKKIYKHIYLRL